ncbi:MAG: TldD protein part of proposed TldE/TldD proteolytic complex [Burkholderiales bacterium]|jgi:TldD protein|nr:TldD protein part of proposed TldE/TldD proteolytic complex [Burkholderiales bacterium]
MINDIVLKNLLYANDLSNSFFNKAAQKLLARGADFCDFYLQYSSDESYSLDEGIIKSGSFALNQGIGIRAICHDKTFLSYSNDLNPKTITTLCDSLFIEPSATNLGPARLYNASASHNLYTINNPILATNNADKVAILKFINDYARKLSYVTNVLANLSLEYDEIYIARSDERQHTDIRPLVHLSISLIINNNGKIEKGNSGVGGRYLLENYTHELLKEHIKYAYDQALLKCEAVAAPSGQLPVVLGNGWAGVILHEAVGHGLEGDFNRKGSSAFSNKIGKQVASKNVTVIDEGCIADRRGSLNIDDEGNPTQQNILIENGILKGYMFDELNARLMGVKSTGNGRRESFACSPMPRMTNTYMQAGNCTHEEIIASVKHGIYAESFEGGQVDITSGQFVFNASTAWVIKNGKLAHPVKGCALVGSGPECLKHVSMVGNNLELDSGIGVCGKNGQSVPVGVGQPSIKIDQGLTIGGTI